MLIESINSFFIISTPAIHENFKLVFYLSSANENYETYEPVLFELLKESKQF